jgi:hypothetical protein
MSKLLSPKRAVIVLAILAAVVVATGVATGAIPAADGTVTGCYKAKGGALRVIDAEGGATCATDEAKLSWNKSGPAGPAGPAGAKGDTGPQGPAACDAARLLLCPEADLATGQTMVLSIDGVELVRVSRYRINCTTKGAAPTCEIALTGAAPAPTNIDAWYETAAEGQAAATRSFTLTVNDASGTPVRKFFVDRGRPTDLLNEGDSYQLTLTADRVLRIST